jgi:hypothetical protein
MPACHLCHDGDQMNRRTLILAAGSASLTRYIRNMVMEKTSSNIGSSCKPTLPPNENLSLEQPQVAPARFAAALISAAPSPDLSEAAEAFGWLVGGWAAEVEDFDRDGRVRRGTGEWWFSWVLEGRAIQDVWIVPPRKDRGPGPLNPAGSADNRYGTSIRWLDRSSEQWRVVWVNPVSGALNLLAGRRKGDCVLLEGQDDGQPVRWSFNDIRSDSFVWRGESRVPGDSWRLDSQFRLKRIAKARSIAFKIAALCRCDATVRKTPFSQTRAVHSPYDRSRSFSEETKPSRRNKFPR